MAVHAHTHAEIAVHTHRDIHTEMAVHTHVHTETAVHTQIRTELAVHTHTHTNETFCTFRGTWHRNGRNFNVKAIVYGSIARAVSVFTYFATTKEHQC